MFSSLFSRKVTLPVLALKPDIAVQQYKKLERITPNTYYTVKSNPHPSIIRALDKHGAKFSVTSSQHLALLRKLRVHPGKIMYAPPIGKKSAHGVAYTLFSSLMHYQQVRPTGRVAFRVKTFSKPTHHRFMKQAWGIPASTLETFILRESIPVYALHLHVATQITELRHFTENAEQLLAFALRLKKKGVPLQVLNLGGGIPVAYLGKKVPSFTAMRTALQRFMRKAAKHNLRIDIEPGRFISAPAGMLHAAVRQVEHNLLTLDTSFYAAYLDTVIAGVLLPVTVRASTTRNKVKKTNKQKQYILQGLSTCSFGCCRGHMVA